MTTNKNTKPIKILFVCTGNICRSPMAQIIFENIAKKHQKSAKNDQKYAGFVVKSAGIGAQYGEFTSDLALLALKKCGEGTHKPFASTLFTREMIGEFDRIVCMTAYHKQRIDPGSIYFNVQTLANYDIPDPWGYAEDIYIEVCKQLQTAVKELYNNICKM